jgi:hypothetical protein
VAHDEGLARGDRLPPVHALLGDGSELVLAEDAAGMPVVLVVGPRPDDPALAGAAAVVVHVPTDGRPATAGLSVLDDGCLAAALTGGRPGVVVAGPDHRVLGVGPPDALAALLALLASRSADADADADADPGLVRRRAAPLLVVDDVLDPETCADVLACATAWTPSPVVRPGPDGTPVLVPDPAVKQRLDDRLPPALAERVVRLIERRLLPEVARGLAHRPRSFEALKLVRYDAGAGWFAPHRDDATADVAHRRLAVTVNLDDGYEGGDLTFPELGPERYRPLPGAAIVFSCGLLHAVTPVRTGTRHALVTFLW